MTQKSDGSEFDFKNDPAYFECMRQCAWLRRLLCVQYQEMALQTSGRTKNAYNTYVRMCGYNQMITCLDCEQGRQIRKTVNNIEPLRVTVKVKSKGISPGSQALDWDALMRAYNTATGTTYLSIKQWLNAVHQQHKRVLAHTANAIGVSRRSLGRKFKHLHIDVKGDSEVGKRK